MKDVMASVTPWQRVGSSVIWEPRLWGPLVAAAPPITLRQALSWLDGGFPAAPPVQGPVLIVGLQTCMEVLDEEVAFRFLRQRLQRLITIAQDRWASTALVFGMSCTANSWRIDAQEHAHLKVRGGHEVQFTFGLWGGAASSANRLIVRVEEAGKQQSVFGGFHLARWS